LVSAEDTDYLPAIEAADAQSADAVLALVILPDQCLGMARSLQQAGVTKPVISFFSCVTTGVKTSFGDYPKWTYFSFTPNVLGPPANPEQAAEFQAYEQWVAPFASHIPDATSAALNLSTVLTIDRVLNQVGATKLTPKAIGSAMHSFHGPVILGAPKLAFGAVSTFNNIGTLGSQFPTYAGSGKWLDPTHGLWLVPPDVQPGIYN
jgi:branched-chain amino acid transport system substrate-binding protein